MKKWLGLAMGGVVMMNAHSANLFCGYKDYFHLSDDSHPGIYIVGGSSDNDVYLQIVGPRSFVLRDTDLCLSGYAQITVAYDSEHYCVLNVKDGPYLMTPTVGASCAGMNYISTTYDGWGSYSYSINLD